MPGRVSLVYPLPMTPQGGVIGPAVAPCGAEAGAA